jgi:hypothetical protein
MKVADAKVASLEIIDSYVIDWENPTMIDGPERLLEYLPHRNVSFV